MTAASTTDNKKKSKFYRSRWFWTAIILLAIVGIAMPKDSPKQAKSNTAHASATTSEPQAAATPAPEPTTVKPSQQPRPKAPTVPPEYTSALYKANSYANDMNMSKQGVYDQLVSDYGEKFSAEAAQYAIDNVKANWGMNALAKAKSYQNDMHLSPEAIRDQLVSDYGEKFTAAEADFAIQHLND